MGPSRGQASGTTRPRRISERGRPSSAASPSPRCAVVPDRPVRSALSGPLSRFPVGPPGPVCPRAFGPPLFRVPRPSCCSLLPSGVSGPPLSFRASWVRSVGPPVPRVAHGRFGGSPLRRPRGPVLPPGVLGPPMLSLLLGFGPACSVYPCSQIRAYGALRSSSARGGRAPRSSTSVAPSLGTFEGPAASSARAGAAHLAQHLSRVAATAGRAARRDFGRAVPGPSRLRRRTCPRPIGRDSGRAAWRGLGRALHVGLREALATNLSALARPRPRSRRGAATSVAPLTRPFKARLRTLQFDSTLRTPGPAARGGRGRFGALGAPVPSVARPRLRRAVADVAGPALELGAVPHGGRPHPAAGSSRRPSLRRDLGRTDQP